MKEKRARKIGNNEISWLEKSRWILEQLNLSETGQDHITAGCFSFRLCLSSLVCDVITEMPFFSIFSIFFLIFIYFLLLFGDMVVLYEKYSRSKKKGKGKRRTPALWLQGVRSLSEPVKAPQSLGAFSRAHCSEFVLPEQGDKGLSCHSDQNMLWPQHLQWKSLFYSGSSCPQHHTKDPQGWKQKAVWPPTTQSQPADEEKLGINQMFCASWTDSLATEIHEGSASPGYLHSYSSGKGQ